MNAPKILYDNILNVSTATLTATASTDHPIANITDWRTHTYWTPTSTANHGINLDLGAGGGRAADSIGIGAHNLYTSGYGFIINASEDYVSWSTLLRSTYVGSDDVIFSTFARTTARYWRITLYYHTTGLSLPYLGVVALGTALEFPKPTAVGSSPINMGIEMVSRQSQTGVMLGNIIKYHPMSMELSFNMVPATFFRTTAGVPANYGLFWNNHAKYAKPFFVSFAEDDFPEAKYLMRLDEGYRYSMPLYNKDYVQTLNVPLISCFEDTC